MKIAIDLKNLALYGGGISHWASEFLQSWINSFSKNDFFTIAPVGDRLKEVDLFGAKSSNHPWPVVLPRQLRHPAYDNFIFPRMIKKINPELIFSPYFDVRMPVNIPSVITIHDLCFIEAGHLYPKQLKNYYLHMMSLNLSRAKHILTVSNSTRNQLINIMGVSSQRISVVPNAISDVFINFKPSIDLINTWRDRLSRRKGEKFLLYTGGVEYRKNISGLIGAMRRLSSQGNKVTLLITGEIDAKSRLFLNEGINHEGIIFLGRLSEVELRLAYSSVDAVVYPTFSEGFGRVCLEAMGSGTPLACSDLNVFQEIAGSYPIYFNPHNVSQIADSILKAVNLGPQEILVNPEFTASNVRAKFLTQISLVMDRFAKR